MKMFHLTKNLPDSIFRAYDIRGVVNETLTGDTIYTIARGIAAQALDKGQGLIIIGRDGRLSSPLFSQAVISGLIESGLDVIDIGAVPTPLLYFATFFLQSRSGIMLTGSHNPANYNGLKIVLDGKTLADQEIRVIKNRALEQQAGEGNGKVVTVDIVPAYLGRITSDVSLRRPLKVVVDAGNGITGKVAPELCRQLGCEVIELFCEVDGNFPNHHPDPSEEKNLQDLIAKVQAVHADIGLAFDGDGDRLGAVTNKGEIIWPDRQIMSFAQEVLTRNPGATVLYDVKCSKFLEEVIAKAGGKPFMWKTGHSYIKNKMKEVAAVLAGEMSGHIFFKDRWYGFDDALYAAARLLEIVAAFDGDAATLFSQLPNSVNTAELHIPLSDEEKFLFMKQLAERAEFPGATIDTIDGLRVNFPFGFGLIRPSNTTPNLVLRFEADTSENLTRIQGLFREQILEVNPNLQLPF